MAKAVWYLLHNLTQGTLLQFKGQRQLTTYLRRRGCVFDNNALVQILLPCTKAEDFEDENIGEQYFLTAEGEQLCVEELA